MEKKWMNYMITGIVICVVTVFMSCRAHAEYRKNFTISQAVSLGMAKSRDYKKVKSKILMKEVKYKEAVKSIALKKKNMSTFRWSPLLSFKFPEKAALTQEYEFMYKPLQISSEISSLKHRLEDIKYETKEEVKNLYTQIYTYQEKIAYEEEKLLFLKTNLERNQAKLITGEAKQSDVDKLSSSVTKTESTLSADKRAFEKGKSDLSDLTGQDLTGNYEFLNPYKESGITRDNLDSLIQYTLSNDQGYYEASLTSKLALISMDTNYGLMSNRYGSKMGYISKYVNQARAGKEVDNEAFKSAYDSFLTAIDAPWQGKKRILFIRIPKEWFKGSIDGVRYVEDDPYLLYSNVLEYQDAFMEQQSLKTEITKSVKEGFENLVTAKNSYEALDSEKNKAEAEMKKAALLNKAGELEFEEYEEVRENYEELNISTMEALELYTTLLYSYDRLTCGGVTRLLEGADLSMGEGIQGESFLSDGMEDKAYYYITSQVEDNIFEVGVYIPEDYETEVTHFELWVDRTQIGERKEMDKTIRHLTLTLDNTEKVFLRFYADDTFVADCEINPQEYQGELDFKVTKKEQKDEEMLLGSYTYTKNKKTGMITFRVTPKEGLGITGFRLLNENGAAVYSEDVIPVSEGLTYLSILSADFSKVTIELYGGESAKLYTGRLKTETKEIYNKE